MKIMTEKLILEKIDNIAKITINNPSANTWDLESLAGLEEIIEHLNQDDEIFSLSSIEKSTPCVCAPSRSVVSNIYNRSLLI